MAEEMTGRMAIGTPDAIYQILTTRDLRIGGPIPMLGSQASGASISGEWQN